MEKENTVPLKIAFYGKGGIGKSTISSNMAAAFAQKGLKVLFIGCDPKADSVQNIVGRKIPTIIRGIFEKGEKLTEEDYLYKGFLDISCLETGGPEPGVGCAGRGIISMFDQLESQGVFDRDWDVILYDVLGDVVCGGFAVPMREAYVDQVYLVSSSEYMSIYAANNIMKSVKNFSQYRDPFLGGLIYNQRQNIKEAALIDNFSQKTGVPILGSIPFSRELAISELQHKTVFEGCPETKITQIFSSLADRILADATKEKILPNPLDEAEMEDLSKEYLKFLTGGDGSDQGNP